MEYKIIMEYIRSRGFLDSVRERGIPLVSDPDNRVVVTGVRMMTPFGNDEQTWQAFLDGRSATRRMENVINYYTNLGAPLPDDYDPLTLSNTKRITRLSAMSILLAREAGIESGLLTPEGIVNTDVIHPYRMGIWIGSGVAESALLIDIHNRLHKVGDKIVVLDDVLRIPKTKRQEEQQTRMIARLQRNSRRLPLDLALGPFPEELPGDTAIATGTQGHSGYLAEACATGASAIVQGYESIRLGLNKAVIAGGFEDALYNHPEVVHALFATGVRALSARLDDPSSASRPFDLGRDGFVPGSGGALLVLESERHAKARGAKILAELFAAGKAIDGTNKTELNAQRVADLMGTTLYDPRTDRLRKPSAIFAHATSTKVGDPLEAEALYKVFGDDLSDIPTTALKSYLGHLLGGAGSVNAVAAVRALQEGIVPRILNLEKPDPKILDKYPLNLVRGNHLHTPLESILAVAYGFGGFNAVLHIGRYVP